jgi:hypothetical protein
MTAQARSSASSSPSATWATIIDFDGLTVGAQQRFMTAFCEEVYRCNTRPLHLVIEEAEAPMTGAEPFAMFSTSSSPRSGFRVDFLLALNSSKYPGSGSGPGRTIPLCAQDR